MTVSIYRAMRFFRELVGDRRDFFRATARYTFLTVLGLAGYFSLRKSKLNQQCVKQGICIHCPQLEDCGLPAALSRKQVESGRRA